jgi:hypothetical protein
MSSSHRSGTTIAVALHMTNFPRLMLASCLSVSPLVGCVMAPEQAEPLTPHKYVFATSTSYSGDFKTPTGAATGLEGADKICQVAATGAGLSGTFQAWISTSTVHAIDHVSGAGPWYRMDDTLVFLNHASLWTAPDDQIDIDEKKRTIGSDPVWTGTGVGGHRAPLRTGALSSTCNDWGLPGWKTVSGEAGVTSSVDAGWTAWYGATCERKMRIFCFEL